MIADSSDVGFLLLNGLNVLGVSTEFKDSGLERHTVERTYLGSTLRRKLLNGVSSCEIEQTGDFDDAAGSSHDAFKAPGSDKVLSWCLAGNTIGKHFSGALVDQLAYVPAAQADEFTTAAAKYTCSEREDGLIIADLVARGAAGNTEATYVDSSASSTLGGVGYLQLSALTLDGYDDLVVKVRHSPDHAAWADLLTFTARTAIGAERKTIATDPIEQYLSVSWSWTGAGAGPSATFTVGFARN